MSNWKLFKIGDLCDTISETYKRNDDLVILINTSDVLDGEVLNHEPVPNKKLKGQFKKTFKRNDILYSEIRPANKRFAFIDFDDTARYIASTKLMVLRAREDIVLPQYLFAVLKSQMIIEELQHLAETRSGTFPQITFLSELAPMEIMLPDFTTQHQIVSLLTSIEGKIKINAAINENLEQQAQAILKSWFVDFEPFGGKMPDNWNECILDSICSLIIKGITPKYVDQSDQLVINQKCVRNHQVDLSLARCHEPKKVNEKWLQYGDIVVNSTGTGTLGRAAQVLFIPNNLTVDSHVTIIRALKKEYLYYLGLWATSHEHDFEMLQTGSTGQTDLPRERLKQMPIILPSKDILCKFSEVIKPIADIKIKNQQENQHLTVLRNTLLPKLMNGEIDVSKVQI